MLLTNNYIQIKYCVIEKESVDKEKYRVHYVLPCGINKLVTNVIMYYCLLHDREGVLQEGNTFAPL